MELFTQHSSLRRVLDALGAQLHVRLTAVHLVDAHLCTEASKWGARTHARVCCFQKEKTKFPPCCVVARLKCFMGCCVAAVLFM